MESVRLGSGAIKRAQMWEPGSCLSSNPSSVSSDPGQLPSRPPASVQSGGARSRGRAVRR